MRWEEICEVLTYDYQGSDLRCRCQTAAGQEISLNLRVIGPVILRVQLGEAPSHRVVDTGDRLGPHQLEETEDALVLATADFKAVITKKPFHFAVYDSQGYFRCGEAESDLNVALKPLAKSAGYFSGSQSAGLIGSLKLRPGEAIFGLGEKFTALDKRGQRIVSWNVDACGVGTEASYKNIPFCWSTEGYGVFFNTTCRMVHEVGYANTSSSSYIFTVDDRALEYFLFFGSPRQVVSLYTGICGRGPLPPLWALGIWFSRCYYRHQSEAEQVAKTLRELEIPAEVITLDGRAWLDTGTRCDFRPDPTKVPDLPGFIAAMRRYGFRICFWEYPYLSVESPLYPEAAAKGYFLRDLEGKPLAFEWEPAGFNEFLTLLPASSIVDFTNPEAVLWYQALHIPLLEAGVDFFKTDFGEQVPEESYTMDGRSGREFHNIFSVLYNRTVYEVTAAHGRSGPLVFARSGWAGLQQYPCSWGGDSQASWEGLYYSIRGGLSYTASGVPIWTSDVGGFYGSQPDPELYIRWVQFGTFCPLMRCHGTTPREPWEYGEQALAIFKQYADLRYRLLPYLYIAAAKATQDGTPALRPLAMDYPDDPLTVACEDEYLLGESLLIAPVYRPGSRERRIYLPAGNWLDYWTGEAYAGNTGFAYPADLERIPVFVKTGAVIPQGPVLSPILDKTPVVNSLEICGATEATLESYGILPADFFRMATNGTVLRIESREDSKVQELVFFHPKRPGTVKVNGQRIGSTPAEATSWSYFSESRRLMIRLDPWPARAEIAIE